MVEPLSLQNLAWALTTVLEVLLLFCLLRRKLHRSHPAFFAYILSTIFQSMAAAIAYRHWGFQSIQSWNVFWVSQGVVVCARWLAITEIARTILANYSGIWKLASRFLFAVGIGVLVYSVLAIQNSWQSAVLNAGRAVELSIAAFLVVLLLFARYYRVPIATLERYLVIGFCLYSCFWVIDDSILAHWRAPLAGLWGFLDVVTFFATLILWIRAVQESTEAAPVTAPAPVSPETHAKLSLEVNTRLHLLNKQLDHLLRAKDSRS